MKRLIVNLIGTVTYSASRSFVVKVPDDVNISNVDQNVLESLADDAKIAWEFHAEGFVQTTDHTVQELGSETCDLPVVPLSAVQK